jgi:hypothetical protein
MGRHPDRSIVFVARGRDGNEQGVEEQQQPQLQQHREETKRQKGMRLGVQTKSNTRSEWLMASCDTPCKREG